MSGLSQLYALNGVTFDILLSTTKSEKMKNLLHGAKEYARLTDPILIYGETGVGKNMLAHVGKQKEQES